MGMLFVLLCFFPLLLLFLLLVFNAVLSKASISTSPMNFIDSSASSVFIVSSIHRCHTGAHIWNPLHNYNREMSVGRLYNINMIRGPWGPINSVGALTKSCDRLTPGPQL